MKGIFTLLTFCVITSYAYTQQSNTLSPAEKVYGLSKFWQEVNYNFANFDNVPKLNWDSAYKVFIPKALATTTDFEYFTLLLKFCALLRDGHTRIWYPDSYYTKMSNTMFGDYQIYIENIENKPIIVRINLCKKDEIPIGSEIIAVNGYSAKEYLENEIIPTVSASNDDVIRDWATRAMFWGFMGTKYEVKIKTPDGLVKMLSLTIDKSEEKELVPPLKDESLFTFKWLKDGIAYVALNSFNDPKIDTLFKEKVPELRKAKGLVLDMRENDGGSDLIGTYIAQYFINDTSFYLGKFKTRKNIALRKIFTGRFLTSDTINNPIAAESYKCLHNNLWEDKGLSEWKNDIPEKDRLLFPVVILIGHETGSAGEDFLICFDNCKQIIKMGEHSNGSTGMRYVFDLPGGASSAVCVYHETYPDGHRFVGDGVKPDIEVKRMISDVINNSDHALDEAVKYLMSER
jgi:C-terminal processing protease CtpA/Prc